MVIWGSCIGERERGQQFAPALFHLSPLDLSLHSTKQQSRSGTRGERTSEGEEAASNDNLSYKEEGEKETPSVCRPSVTGGKVLGRLYALIPRSLLKEQRVIIVLSCGTIPRLDTRACPGKKRALPLPLNNRHFLPSFLRTYDTAALAGGRRDGGGGGAERRGVPAARAPRPQQQLQASRAEGEGEGERSVLLISAP